MGWGRGMNGHKMVSSSPGKIVRTAWILWLVMRDRMHSGRWCCLLELFICLDGFGKGSAHFGRQS